MKRGIITAGLLVGLLSCGSGGADRNTKVAQPEPAAANAVAAADTAPKPPPPPPAPQGRQINPAYRSEFIDSLKRNFHVEHCCASPIAQCAEEKPECGIAPRLAAFTDWMGNSWRYDPKMNEQQIAQWLQNHYLSFTDEKKYAIDTNGWPVLGDPKAPVTVVLYYSAFCPASKSSIREMNQAVTAGPLKGKAKIVAKGLNNIPGDKALMAAHDIGRFNDFMRVISWINGPINDFTISDIVDAMRIDKARFNAIMGGESVKKRLEQSSAEAREYNVTRIPTYFISGRRYVSLTSPQWLIGAIEHEHETETLKKK